MKLWNYFFWYKIRLKLSLLLVLELRLYPSSHIWTSVCYMFTIAPLLSLYHKLRWVILFGYFFFWYGIIHLDRFKIQIAIGWSGLLLILFFFHFLLLKCSIFLGGSIGSNTIFHNGCLLAKKNKKWQHSSELTMSYCIYVSEHSLILCFKNISLNSFMYASRFSFCQMFSTSWLYFEAVRSPPLIKWISGSSMRI